MITQHSRSTLEGIDLLLPVLTDNSLGDEPNRFQAGQTAAWGKTGCKWYLIS